MRTQSKALAVLCSAALLLLVLSFPVTAEDTVQPKAPAKKQPGAAAAQSKVPTLDDASRTALLKAIEREREGIQLYGAIVAKHGSIRPFAPILAAEKRQETELLNVAKRFALLVPASAPTNPNVPATVKDSCEAAAKWERDTASLFHQISTDVKRPGIKNTLTRQANLGTERHLPAFEQCVKLGGPLPQKAEGPARCESCGMVDCPCSHAAAATEGAAAGGGTKPAACGCAGDKK